MPVAAFAPALRALFEILDTKCGYCRGFFLADPLQQHDGSNLIMASKPTRVRRTGADRAFAQLSGIGRKPYLLSLRSIFTSLF